MFRFIHLLLTNFSNQLFPTLCLGCSQSLKSRESILCISCRINLPETGQHREPYDQDLLNKFAGKVPIRFIASYLYFKKGGIVQKLIHHIKYKGQKEAAKELANWYGNQLMAECEHTSNIDLIIAVPLHTDRFKQRGYNQSEWIAMGLADALQIPIYNNVLFRNRFEESQTHKNRLERWENVMSVFSVKNPELIRGKNVMLVDDVLTTGATLESCATELLKFDCMSISILTLAVAGS
ncbi:ComF family protein [Spirosoma luteum]|uniref:ComF family protein n=1 Tax=Spirosoma luteum TaxID=431553 RepID=UPI000367D1A2|nr:phosphoribosyltransferase family protein [Spirosoma luteum]